MSGKKATRPKAGTDTDLVEQSAEAERRLLRAERAAEDRLLKARVRLERAEARVDRRRAEVVEAGVALRRRQAARAAGPEGVLSRTPSGGPSIGGNEQEVVEALG